MSRLSAAERLALLTRAMTERRLTRLRRRYEPLANFDCYVTAIGPRWVLLTNISERICVDGATALRLSDILRVSDAPHAQFIEAALASRGEIQPDLSMVSTESLSELLRTAGQAFPVVTIHEEADDPDVCWVGRVEGVGDRWLNLLEIDPDAQWEDSGSFYRLSRITRVDFGGDYETALHLVGGDPPEEEKG